MGGSSIVLNFSHTREHRKDKDPLNMVKQEEQSNKFSPNMMFTPPQSELVSINSFDDGDSMNYNGHPLKLTLTRQDEESIAQLEQDKQAEYPTATTTTTATITATNNNINNNTYHNLHDHKLTPEESIQSYEIGKSSITDMSSLKRSLNSIGTDSSSSISRREILNLDRTDIEEGEVDDRDDEDEDEDIDDLSSDYSVLSILPSISISDAIEGHFRLVLQSILIQHPVTKEIYTAIRQSNNEPTIADIMDDWLLYDSQFSMDNLQILTLQDLLDTNRSFPKILFYSMVIVTDAHHQPIQGPTSTAGPDLTTSYLSNKLESIAGDETNQRFENRYYPMADDQVEDQPQQFFPQEDDHDDDNMYDTDDSLMEEAGPEMYLPTRMETNNTTAHRSIRTVNSIGEWAFNRNNTNGSSSKSAIGREDEDGDEEEETNHHNDGQTHDNNHHHNKKTGKKGSYGGAKNKRSGNIEAMKAVERTKSTPLPTLLKSISGTGTDKKRWKDRLKEMKKKNKSSQEDHSLCNIM